MPIGKNAIKRVTNNGYSKVKAEAPDMENSTVVEEKEAPKARKASAKKTSAEKTTAKKPNQASKAEKPKTEPKAKAPKKSMESEPDLAPVKTLERVTSAPKDEGADSSYVNIGDEMPYYLL